MQVVFKNQMVDVVAVLNNGMLQLANGYTISPPEKIMSENSTLSAEAQNTKSVAKMEFIETDGSNLEAWLRNRCKCPTLTLVNYYDSQIIEPFVLNHTIFFGMYC